MRRNVQLTPNLLDKGSLLLLDVLILDPTEFAAADATVLPKPAAAADLAPVLLIPIADVPAGAAAATKSPPIPPALLPPKAVASPQLKLLIWRDATTLATNHADHLESEKDLIWGEEKNVSPQPPFLPAGGDKKIQHHTTNRVTRPSCPVWMNLNPGNNE